MRYSLWSRGTIIGYTDLDLPHVNPDLLSGFVEPTEAGRQALIDATGVPAVCVKQPARWYERDGLDPETEAYMKAFQRACDRREALVLELRDDRGELFPCAHIRVYDLRLTWPEPHPDEFDAPDDEELDPELRAQMDDDAELARDWMEEIEEDLEADAWKQEDDPCDPRWDTMQYHIQVYVREPSPEALRRELEASEFDDEEPWPP